jgi:hypothetical protein
MTNNEMIYAFIRSGADLFEHKYGKENRVYYEGKKVSFSDLEKRKELEDLKKKAREALLAGDKEASANYYMDVLNENIEDSEAIFFVFVFNTVKLGDIDFTYPILERNFFSALPFGEETTKVARLMVTELALTSRKAISIANQDPNRYRWYLSISKMYRSISKSIVRRKNLGDDFKDDALALQFLKDAVSIRHECCEFRLPKDNGKKLWFDEVIEKIKAVDPSYNPPKFHKINLFTAFKKDKHGINSLIEGL